MKRMVFVAAVAFAAVGGTAWAQAAGSSGVAGDWQGQLKVREDSLPLVFHLGQSVTGDSPAERIFGAPGKLEQSGDRYKVTFEGVGVFEGALSKDGKLEGTYTRGDLTQPLTLVRQEAGTASP